ncbi:MAG: TraR/DksA family transcriptional regulator [Chloroflexota bacterium]
MYHPFTNLPTVKLEADKRKIAGDIKRLEGQLQQEVDPDVDEADPGLSNQVITLALLENAKQKVEAIDRALSQAREGNYGVCEDCAQDIDPERLAIFPQATLCVPCKSAREGVRVRAA